ncbi:MAG: hypothetical protein HQM04_19040, partial [Magnetococcales bacterium]|nr:hypothetical protein [Magnetococcales bacterium]MBF0117124.1 hypothetical protein [Magnetococcales bacterium]
MPDILTKEQLLSFKSYINGTKGGLESFYAVMKEANYGYADLANSVVNCTGASGSTAQIYMSQRAKEQGVTLGDNQILDIETGMAQGYIDALIDTASKNGGTINTEVTFAQALDYHTKVFAANGLGPQTWTLYAPYQVLGVDAMQQNWDLINNPSVSSLVGIGGLMRSMGWDALGFTDISKEKQQTAKTWFLQMIEAQPNLYNSTPACPVPEAILPDLMMIDPATGEFNSSSLPSNMVQNLEIQLGNDVNIADLADALTEMVIPRLATMVAGLDDAGVAEAMANATARQERYDQWIAYLSERTSNGVNSSATLKLTDVSGNQIEDVYVGNMDGSVNYQQSTSTADNGQKNVTISGYGDITNLDNAVITLTTGSSAIVIGTGNLITDTSNNTLLTDGFATVSSGVNSMILSAFQDLDGDGATDRVEISFTDMLSEKYFTQKDYDNNGQTVAEQLAHFDAETQLTMVKNIANGNTIAEAMIQGVADWSTLEQEALLAIDLSQSSSLTALSTANNEYSLFDALDFSNNSSLHDAFSEVDDNVASGFNNDNTGISAGESYGSWLNKRANDGSISFEASAARVNNNVGNLIADPQVWPLEDGALAVSLAQQKPSTFSVLLALQKLVLAGNVLSDTIKNNTALLLGTTPEAVNQLVVNDGLALLSIVDAFQDPTPTKMATALLQTMRADFPFSKDLRDHAKIVMEIDDAALDQLMDFGGVGLAVVSLMQDPTPQNIISASAQTTNLMKKLSDNPAKFEQLSMALSYGKVAVDLYNFFDNPNPQSAVSSLMSVGMVVAPAITMPIAAALTVAQLVLPGPTETLINAVYNLGQNIWNFVSNGVEEVTEFLEDAWDSFTDFIGLPLVINLAGGNVHTTELAATSPLFDIMGTGEKFRTSWITPDEGFLVRDLDGNGKIESIRELFSEINASDGKTAFAILADLDSNQNNLIDTSDTAWNSLKIWVDKNMDAISQSDELYTLAQHGIVNINLNAKHGFTFDNGNLIGDTSTFTRQDGSKGEIADAMFRFQEQNASTPQTTPNQIVMGSTETTVRLSNGATAQFVTGNNQNINVSNR